MEFGVKSPTRHPVEVSTPLPPYRVPPHPASGMKLLAVPKVARLLEPPPVHACGMQPQATLLPVMQLLLPLGRRTAGMRLPTGGRHHGQTEVSAPTA